MVNCSEFVCFHGGTCDDLERQTPYCICTPRFTGKFCEKSINQPLLPNDISLTPDSRQGTVTTTPEVSALFLATLGLTFLVVLLIILGIIKFGRKRVHVTKIFQPPSLSKFPPIESFFYKKKRTWMQAAFNDIDLQKKKFRDFLTSETLLPDLDGRMFTMLHEKAASRGCLQLDDDLRRCVNVQDELGRIAIHWCADAEADKSEYEIISDINTLLLAGEPIDAIDDFGRTPLHLSIRRGRAAVSLRLLTQSSISYLDLDGYSPLYYAVANGMVDVVGYILKNFKIDVNYLYNNKETILQKAVRVGNLEVIKILVNQKNIDLHKCGSSPEDLMPMHLATQFSHMEVFKLLHQKTGNANCIDRYNRTPLLIAVQFNQIPMISYLLSLGALSVATLTSDFGESPIKLAQLKQNQEILNMFWNFRRS
uniref:EGF-like domain-containing protein n=1 Tax=Panagrolaimus sp. JU765 TaxID=591449 RepID=A0AC34RFQ2_9BILA